MRDIYFSLLLLLCDYRIESSVTSDFFFFFVTPNGEVFATAELWNNVTVLFEFQFIASQLSTI